MLLVWNCYGFGDGANKSNQSPNLATITIITPKPIGTPTSITIINHKSIGNLASITIITPKPIGNLASITSINPKTNHCIYIHP